MRTFILVSSFLFFILFGAVSAKEKLRGQLGVKLGDNIIEATYDPKFRKDYQQFEFLTGDDYLAQIYSERQSKKVVYIANVFIMKNKQECVRQRNKDIVDVQKEYILPPKKGQEVGFFGVADKDAMVFGDEEIIVNFSCLTIPNADPQIKDQYRVEILTRKFNTFLAVAMKR
jgi:hypothetical protein